MGDQKALHRSTKQRRLILDAVKRHMDHPNADAIYMDVHAEDPKISKATVYRNLKILADGGEILQVRFPDADRYDRTLTAHYHIRCTVCNAVVDAPIAYASESDRAVSQQTGFRIFGHRLVFEGICPECQKKVTVGNAPDNYKEMR